MAEASTAATKAAPKRKTTARKAPAKRKTAAKRKTTAKSTVKKANTRARKTTAQAEKTVSKLADRAQETSRKAFLASLGFYGKAFDQVQEQFNSLQDKVETRRSQASELYEELVTRGEKVETDARDVFEDIELPSLASLTDREALEARLDKARERFAELKESVGFKSAV